MVESDTQSWDDFWAERNATRRTETIRGMTVPVPTDLSMRVLMRVEQLADSAKLADVKSLVKDVFGEDLFDALVDAGMGHVEFKTLLAWGAAHGSGRPVGFAEAYDMVADAEGKAEAAPNRAARRAGKDTGGPSKRTSAANTSSRRKR